MYIEPPELTILHCLCRVKGVDGNRTYNTKVWSNDFGDFGVDP
jgi:hypothetical protein